MSFHPVLRHRRESPATQGPRSLCLPGDSNPQHLPLPKFLTSSGVSFSHAVVALSHATATHRVSTFRAFPTMTATGSFPPRFPHDVARQQRSPSRGCPLKEPEPSVQTLHPSVARGQPSPLRRAARKSKSSHQAGSVLFRLSPTATIPRSPPSTGSGIRSDPEVIPSSFFLVQHQHESKLSPLHQPKKRTIKKASNTSTPQGERRLVTSTATERPQRPVLQPRPILDWKIHLPPPRQA